MDLDPKYFASAISEYQPLKRNFFVAEDCSFSNYSSISQGEVGDCWLLAPLAALSKSRQLRTVLMGNFGINPEQQTYAVGLFKSGERVPVEINGELYFIPKKGAFKSDLLFAGQQQFLPEKASVPLERLWFAFVEKAVAKVMGGYHMLDGGDPWPEAKQAAMGFSLLTGMPVMTITINAATDFKGSLKDMLTQGAAIVFTTKANSLVSSERAMKSEPRGVDKSGFNLLEDHAYVVDSIARDGSVKLYNPHGEFPKLKHNKAEQLTAAACVEFGARLDIVMPKVAAAVVENKPSKTGGRKTRRRRRTRKN